jgi:hypothetical protein
MVSRVVAVLDAVSAQDSSRLNVHRMAPAVRPAALAPALALHLLTDFST